jgi:hypothetical protein
MKLNDVKPSVETSGDLQEQFFAIEDQGMIFDILRNKMYSNSVLAICREISCNARDAHREVGKGDVPIEITLPNHLEPVYKIKDFGPGISPSRMVNVFIKYTASTKRLDNVQTGGFGLGAKTPFSYSDSFNIVTCVDGIQYNYACFIDETKVGKLALLSEAPTEDPNGTTIIIPVKPKDFNSFRDCTEQSTRYWDVQPIIKGDSVKSLRAEPTLSGKDWFIAQSNHYYHDLKLIVDGIEYPVELEALRKYADCKLIDSCRGALYLNFDVGEVSLSANREQISLDAPTQNKISTRLALVTNEINKNVESKIDQFPNLWNANVFYRNELNNIFARIEFLGKLNWRGVELKTNNTFGINCEVFHFSKGGRTFKVSSDTDGIRLRRTRSQHICLEDKSKLVINDLDIKEPTPRHVKKAFEDNPDLHSIQLICPNDKISVKDLNDKHHLDKMGYLSLSDLTKASARNKNKSSTNRLLVFQFDRSSYHFSLSTLAAVEEDTNKIKVLCQLKKDDYYHSNREVVLKNKKHISTEVLHTLLGKNQNISIYGVDVNTDPARVAEEFDGFIGIDEFIESWFANNVIDYVGVKYAQSQRYHIGERILRLKGSILKSISDPDSPALRFIKNLSLVQDLMSDENSKMIQCYENYNECITSDQVKDWKDNHQELDVEKNKVGFGLAYPLLNVVNEYELSGNVSAVIEYINLIDLKNKKLTTLENI